MELPRAVFDGDMVVEFLEFKAPAVETLVRTFEVHEPLEGDMISDDGEL